MYVTSTHFLFCNTFLAKAAKKKKKLNNKPNNVACKKRPQNTIRPKFINKPLKLFSFHQLKPNIYCTQTVLDLLLI